MADESQLLALQKACEVQEQTALQRKREVDRVRAERQNVVDRLQERIDALKARLTELTGPNRRSAMCRSDVGELQSITEFVARKRRELASVQEELEERAKELQQAVERSQIAEREFASARLETRRVEKILEERNALALVRGSALEEIALDELVSSRRSKS